MSPRMLSTLTLLMVLPLAVCQAQPLQPPKDGPDKGSTVIKGQLSPATHMEALKLEQGNIYRIVVKATDFTPVLKVSAPQSGFAAWSVTGEGNTAALLVLANQSGQYSAVVSPTFTSKQVKGPLSYEITVEKLKLAGEAVGKATVQAPAPHLHKMEAKKHYIVQAIAKNFNPRLSVKPASSSLSPLPYVGYKDAGDYVTVLWYGPTQSGDHEISVTAGEPTGAGALDYEVRIFPPHEHSQSLREGTTYHVKVVSKSFSPQVRVVKDGQILASASGFLKGKDRVASVIFRPTTTGQYSVFVGPGYGPPFVKDLTDHQVFVTKAKPILEVTGKLDKNDAVSPKHPGRHIKVHEVKLTANVTYQFEMTSQGFAPKLYLERSSGLSVKSSTSPVGGNTAAMTYNPITSDTYRLIASSVDPGQTGPYTLTVLGPDDGPGAALNPGVKD